MVCVVYIYIYNVWYPSIRSTHPTGVDGFYCRFENSLENVFDVVLIYVQLLCLHTYVLTYVAAECFPRHLKSVSIWADDLPYDFTMLTLELQYPSSFPIFEQPFYFFGFVHLRKWLCYGLENAFVTDSTMHACSKGILQAFC